MNQFVQIRSYCSAISGSARWRRQIRLSFKFKLTPYLQLNLGWIFRIDNDSLWVLTIVRDEQISANELSSGLDVRVAIGTGRPSCRRSLYSWEFLKSRLQLGVSDETWKKLNLNLSGCVLDRDALCSWRSCTPSWRSRHRGGLCGNDGGQKLNPTNQ